MARIGLVKLGDISYSLYLVHWPIVAFMNNAFIGEPTLQYRLGALGLSIGLAALLYAVVENPIHHKNVRPSLRNITALLMITVLLGGSQYGVTSSASAKLMGIRRANWGLSPACDNGKSLSDPKCRTTDNPEILVWGDSYGMHVVPGVVASTDKGVRQATMSSCAPVLHCSISHSIKSYAQILMRSRALASR